MGERPRILVVEDEYMLAEDVADGLRELGAEVVGPVPALDEALAIVEQENDLAGAVLDINLRGELVYPVADALRAKGVRILFATGYDAGAIPERYGDIDRCEKPLTDSRLKSAFAATLKLADQPRLRQ